MTEWSDDPLSARLARLPAGIPDEKHGASTRARCHAVLERRRRQEAATDSIARSGWHAEFDRGRRCGRRSTSSPCFAMRCRRTG